MLKWSLLLFIFFAQKLGAQILVTGFDDNLRQSENVSTIGSVKRFLFKEDEPYSGMTLLYSLMQKRSSDGKIYILTGMPSLFQSRAEKFLKKENFPLHELVLRNLLLDWPTSNFKLKKIDDWMRNGANLILVKDNCDVSLELASKVSEKYGPRLLKFYSRETSQRELPDFATPYITPMDIAREELLAGRLSRPDVEKVLIMLLNEENPERIIPRWSYCPLAYNPCPENIFPICPQLSQKVQSICKQRKEKS